MCSKWVEHVVLVNVQLLFEELEMCDFVDEITVQIVVMIKNVLGSMNKIDSCSNNCSSP